MTTPPRPRPTTDRPPDPDSGPIDASDHARWVSDAVEQYERPLVGYAARLLHGDVDRARDVVQDTFHRLCRAERATVDGHLAQWLYTVCRNRALDVGRKERRMKTLNERQVETAPAPSSASDAESVATSGPVAAALAGLPPRQQEAVRLKFQGGLSYREISSVMDTTVNNVGVLIHTALKSIRETLGETAPDGTINPGVAR